MTHPDATEADDSKPRCTLAKEDHEVWEGTGWKADMWIPAPAVVVVSASGTLGKVAIELAIAFRERALKRWPRVFVFNDFKNLVSASADGRRLWRDWSTRNYPSFIEGHTLVRSQIIKMAFQVWIMANRNNRSTVHADEPSFKSALARIVARQSQHS